jgi:uncharacterized protein GlcG (DUF336 family)
VLLRDRYAGPHTVEVATNKAWTAVSFRTNTDGDRQGHGPNTAMSGLRQFPRAVAVGGGADDSGRRLARGRDRRPRVRPGGDNDDVCAAAGIKAISDDLELG